MKPSAGWTSTKKSHQYDNLYIDDIREYLTKYHGNIIPQEFLAGNDEPTQSGVTLGNLSKRGRIRRW